MDVYFAHGKESGPGGRKIVALGRIAQGLGFGVRSLDFTDSQDPEYRVKKLLSSVDDRGDDVILAGSSMGGYVSTVASESLRPAGLFLMAPAFYLPGYDIQDPVPHAGKTVVVHGWRDEVVPSQNAVRFARRHEAELHLLPAGHTLAEAMDLLETIFAEFLESIMKSRFAD